MNSQLNATGQLLVAMAKQCQEDSERWFGDSEVSDSVPHHVLALAGEVGELANIIKKIERGSLDFGSSKVRYDVAMEIADIFTYLLNLSGMLHINLERVYNLKRTENQKRFTEQRDEREVKRMNAIPQPQNGIQYE